MMSIPSGHNPIYIFFKNSMRERERKWLETAKTYSIYLVSVCLKKEGKKMSKIRSSRGVSLRSDEGTAKPTTLQRNRKRVITVLWVFRLPKSGRFSPESFLRRVGAKVAKVVRYVSLKKRSECSKKASAATNFNRSHSVSDSMEESHRAEAVKDCIHFFNSSSSSAV